MHQGISGLPVSTMTAQPAVFGRQERLQPPFQREAELVGVDGVDAAVHEAEAVRGADDGIRGNIDWRVTGEGAWLRGEDVSLADADSRHARKCFLPGGCQGRTEVAEMNFKDRHPARVSHLVPSAHLLNHPDVPAAEYPPREQPLGLRCLLGVRWMPSLRVVAYRARPRLSSWARG